MNTEQDPDWELPLALTLTPAMLIHSLFPMAQQVHTGSESCVDPKLALNELMAVDQRTGNHARLVEQEYVEDGDDDESIWHDWTVEVRIGDVWVTGHWQQPVHGSPVEWEWCAREAERAFRRAAVLFGKQVRPGLVVVDDPAGQPPMPNQRRH